MFSLKTTFFRDATSFSLLEIYWCFRRMYFVHFLRKYQQISTRLHGVISLKTVIFIVPKNEKLKSHTMLPCLLHKTKPASFTSNGCIIHSWIHCDFLQAGIKRWPDSILWNGDHTSFHDSEVSEKLHIWVFHNLCSNASMGEVYSLEYI